jgi:hypothetical protein
MTCSISPTSEENRIWRVYRAPAVELLEQIRAGRGLWSRAQDVELSGNAGLVTRFGKNLASLVKTCRSQ